MQSPELEKNVETILLKKWHLILGIVSFFLTVVFPVIFFGFRLDKNQALQAQSINTIQLNHEAHMQAALEEIAELEASDVDIRAKINTDHDAIIRLLENIK